MEPEWLAIPITKSSRPSSSHVHRQKEYLTASLLALPSAGHRRQSVPLITRSDQSPRLARHSIGARPEVLDVKKEVLDKQAEERTKNFQNWLQKKMQQRKHEKKMQELRRVEETERKKSAHVQGTKSFSEWCAEVKERSSIRQRNSICEQIEKQLKNEFSEILRHKTICHCNQLPSSVINLLEQKSFDEHEMKQKLKELRTEKAKMSQAVYHQWLITKEKEALRREEELLEIAMKPPAKPKTQLSINQRRQSLVQIPAKTRRASLFPVPTRKKPTI